MLDGGLEGGDVVARLGEALVRVAERAEDLLEVGEVGDVRVDEDVDEDGEEVVGAEVVLRARVLDAVELGDLLGRGEERVRNNFPEDKVGWTAAGLKDFVLGMLGADAKLRRLRDEL